MEAPDPQPMNMVTEDAPPCPHLTLHKARWVELLQAVGAEENFILFKNKALGVRDLLTLSQPDRARLFDCPPNEESITVQKEILIAEVNQILDAHTRERADYYLRRLLKSVLEVRTGKINDLNLLRWKEYEEIQTDSLWIVDKRDSSGAHLGSYWGNFVPQIPHQAMLRFTKKGEWVLDAFMGSGTTLIECKRLGRNGIGIELNPEIARATADTLAEEPNPAGATVDIAVGDSRTLEISPLLARHGIQQVQLAILHPPYHDIIRFSEDERDLSNADTLDQFLQGFGAVVDNLTPSLQKGRYLLVVIGDKYLKGEWIPLGFYCMNEIMKRPYRLKSIVVKNYDRTKGKRQQKSLWRYRALAGGFYVFKHEYLLLFQKR